MKMVYLHATTALLGQQCVHPKPSSAIGQGTGSCVEKNRYFDCFHQTKLGKALFLSRTNRLKRHKLKRCNKPSGLQFGVKEFLMFESFLD